MDLKKFVTQNWISIPTTAIAIVSFIFTVYFYRKSTYERIPVFRSDPIGIEILNADRISEAPIKVIRAKDNSEITSNLFAIRFSFWNSGRKPIENQDIRRSIRVELDDPEVEIMESKVIKSSDDINFRLTRDPSNPDRSVLIDFTILEKNEGATCQIIYGGDSQADLTIDGRIKEADGILTSTTQNLYFLDSAWGIVKWVLLIAGSMYIFILVRTILLLRETKKLGIPPRLKDIVIPIIVIIIVVVMFVGVLIMEPEFYSIPSEILP